MTRDFTPEHAALLLGVGYRDWDESVVIWLNNQSRRTLKAMASNLMPEVMETRRVRIQGRWDVRRLQRGTGLAQAKGKAVRL